MRKLALTLAMLCMAIILLAACGSKGGASSEAGAGRQVASTSLGSLPAQATATPSATATPAPSPTATATDTPTPTPTPLPPITFAVIGDDGTNSDGEKAVAQMVNGWNPDFIINTGDAYYSRAGGSGTGKYDRTVGDYYCDFLKDISTTGTACPHGNAKSNRYFPTLGNHDYTDAGIDNYLQYFDLPGSDFRNTSGNERYYDFVWGPVHFYSLDSNSTDPDGVTPDSKQGRWLQAQLAKSRSPWRIVFFHHPPYSSGATHGPNQTMQWPFKDWGVSAVLNGHEHLYERLQVDGLTYFVNGLGGGARYGFGETPAPGSQARVDNNWGAQKVTATDKKITFEFYTVDGKLADTYTIEK